MSTRTAGPTSARLSRKTGAAHHADSIAEHLLSRQHSNRERAEKKGNSSWTPADFAEYLYFKTGNPPGIHDPGLEPDSQALEPVAGTEHYPNRGPLQDLSAYIDRLSLSAPRRMSLKFCTTALMMSV